MSDMKKSEERMKSFHDSLAVFQLRVKEGYDCGSAVYFAAEVISECDELQKINAALLEAAKEREQLLDQCVALLALARPDIHEQALKKVGLSDDQFKALIAQAESEARP